ncbi:MAG TPA: hypothetical protein VMS96_12765, partial [Terriglobales bacterium]|nr:hypothetical protein [Terriglobales bacterium]
WLGRQSSAPQMEAVMVASPVQPPLLGVLGWRLVRLIESHSDALAKGLWERLQNSERTTDYVSRVPPEELKERVGEIYRHLGEWLLKKTEADVEHRYVAIGERRFAQGVRLSQLTFMIVATKEHLWEYVSREALADRPVELFQELELFQLVDQFFDRALYFAGVGFERAQAAARKQ